uniref:Uncharacterized protein n=1 Tax=Cacopsylla melanoneura TaxID=428564 RepID=A0A8D8RID4_9HEMI
MGKYQCYHNSVQCYNPTFRNLLKYLHRVDYHRPLLSSQGVSLHHNSKLYHRNHRSNAQSSHGRRKYSCNGFIQDRQNSPNDKQLLSVQFGCGRLCNRVNINASVHCIHHNGILATGAHGL